MAANVGWKGRMIAPATMAATALFERILRVHQSGEPPMRDVRARIRHIVLVQIEKALPLFSPAYDFGLAEDEIRTSWWNYFSWLHSRHAAAASARTTAAEGG